MPDRALQWERAPDRQERGQAWFHEVARLRGVHADDDLQLGDVFASPDGSILASNCLHFPRTTKEGRPLGPHEIIVERGVAIWHPDKDAAATWVAFPEADQARPFGLYGPVCFSKDRSRLVAASGESLVVISATEARILCEIDPVATFPPDQRIHAHVDWREVAMSEDGGTLSATVLADGARKEDGTCTAAAARATWSIPAGDLRSLESLEAVDLRVPTTLNLEGVPAFNWMLATPPIRSEDARYTAMSFEGFGWYLGAGDTTPAHVRVWDAQTSRLIGWGYAASDGKQRPHPAGFLAQPPSVVYCDDDGVGLVDLERRTEIARHAWPRRSYPHHRGALWIPSRQMLCVPDARTIVMIRVAQP